MTKPLTLLSLLLMFCISSHAQIFWTENFEGGSTSGMGVAGYTGPNGTWSNNVTGPEGTFPNMWYVSCAENGHTTGICGTGCVPVSTTATLSTLHIGANPGVSGDLGASYFAGGCTTYITYYGFSSTYGICAQTDKRAESPVINCTGRTGISLGFYYIAGGVPGSDFFQVFYSPNSGTTWTPISTPSVTPTCSGQGTWEHFSINLPTSANNNPNVKIGFRWTNNEDGFGTDPSVAIDSMTMSGALITPPAPTASFTMTASTTCQDSCINFTSTSTSTVTIDSVRWSISGMTLASPTSNSVTACFMSAGVYTVTLMAYNRGGGDTVTHTVTVIPTPHPVIVAGTGHHVLTTTYTSYTSYQWFNGTTPITGATNSTFTYGANGSYSVVVDSAGCIGYSLLPFTATVTAVQSVNSSAGGHWLSQTGSDWLTLHASESLNTALDITVYEATGRLLISENWPSGSSMKQIKSSEMPPGMYIIKLSGAGTAESLQWIKK